MHGEQDAYGRRPGHVPRAPAARRRTRGTVVVPLLLLRVQLLVHEQADRMYDYGRTTLPNP